MNYFARIIVVFIAVYVIVLMPLQYAGRVQYSISSERAFNITKEFIDNICINKELTIEEYEMYMEKLAKTGSGNLYEALFTISGFIEDGSLLSGIDLGCHIKDYNNKGSSITRSDVISSDVISSNIKVSSAENNGIEGINSEFMPDKTVNAEAGGIVNVFTRTTAVADLMPANGIIKDAVKRTETVHEHDDGCYFGSSHEHSGSTAAGGDCYGNAISHSHSSSCYGQRVCGKYEASGTNTYYDIRFGQCPSCGYGNDTGIAYNKSEASHKYYCSGCSKTVTSTNIIQTKIYYVSKCNGCSETTSSTYDYPAGRHTITNYNNLTCTKPTGTYYELKCKIKEGYYFNGAEETYDPKCGNVIVDIRPVYTEQTIELGANMNSLCIAAFLNGTQTIMELPSNYNKKLGQQNVSLTYHGLLYNAKNIGTITCNALVNTVKYYNCVECGAFYESNAAGNDPGCPVCRHKLLRIKANMIQSVYLKGEILNIEVIAVYKNKEEKVNEWTSNYNAYAIGEQKVTVRYLTESCEVTVFVRSSSETACPECGGIYDMENNNFCPYCSKELIGITAYTDRDEIMTGEELPVYIILKYKDGNLEYLEDGFEIKGYNSHIPGIQHVTVYYKGYEDFVIIKVLDGLRKLINCENNHSYLLDSSGTDSGCPYCSLIDEDITEYLEIHYNDKIMDELYQNGKITFQSGEYISMEVICKKSSISRLKSGMSFENTDACKIVCVYGGRVR